MRQSALYAVTVETEHNIELIVQIQKMLQNEFITIKGKKTNIHCKFAIQNIVLTNVWQVTDQDKNVNILKYLKPVMKFLSLNVRKIKRYPHLEKLIGGTIFNLTIAQSTTNNYFSYWNVPPTCFGLYRPFSERQFKRE